MATSACNCFTNSNFAEVTWPIRPDWDDDRLVLGPTGVGKSFVACALAHKECRDGYSALYTRAQALFRDLAMARADGSLRSLLARLSRIDVLVIEDWVMALLSEPNAPTSGRSVSIAIKCGPRS